MATRAPAPNERDSAQETSTEGARKSEGVPRTEPLPVGPRVRGLVRGATLGRYVVIDKLGEGGMGEVHAAYDRTLDRKVALKLLRSNDKKRQPLLLREAHTMAKLSHPNVVAVFDVGVADERVFIAMEFVDGRTLGAWQRDAPRSRRDLLRVYAEAARGLQAAHSAGLVHRDFKPSNVLISDSGEVKVTDFGVARALDDPRPAPAAGESGEGLRVPRDEPSLTSEGGIVGTPVYMSPEQYLGLGVDARSDQFSFCVALFEALHGQRPFPEGTAAARLDAIARGALRESKRARVPPHWRKALARGLSYDRDARFPSMGELLDQLVRDPAKRTRLVLAIAAGVSLVLSAGAWMHHEASMQHAQLCTGSQAEADATWNDETRRAVEQSLVATGVPYAADTWRRVNGLLGDYMARWSAAHRATCEATRIRGEQSERVMGLRMACLERRRDEVRALTNVLSVADRDVATNAVQASMALTSPDVCARVGPLAAGEAEPADPARRAELAAIWSGLANVKTNLDAGRARVAIADVAPLVGRARALGFEPALAEALLMSSTANADSGTWAQAAEDARLAVFAAEGGGDDPRRALAEIALVHWLTETGRLDEAEGWSGLAEATLRRTSDDGEARAEWLDASGWLFYRQGKNAEAEGRLRAGLEAARRAGATPQRVAKLARALADDEAALGAFDEAQRLVDEADRVLVAAVGEEHPSRIPVLINRSVIAARANKRQDELSYALRAIALAEQVAPEHHALGVAYLDACDALLRLHRYDEALAYCAEAVATSLRVYGENATYVAYAETTTGDVLVGLHRYDEAASHFDDAVAIHERSGTRGDSDYADGLRGLGTVRLQLGKPLEACVLLERALAAAPVSARTSAEEAGIVAAIEYTLARAMWSSGARSSRVGDLARDAAESYRRATYDDDAREVELWLTTHPTN